MAGRSRPALPKAPRTPTKGTGTKAYTEAVREQALRIYAAEGLAAAHRATGAAKSTVLRWASAAGIDDAPARERRAAQTRAATEESVLQRAATAEAARAELVVLQARIAVTASHAELEVLDAFRAWATSPAAVKTYGDGASTPRELRRLQAALAGPRLSELVGAKTRAIHDLQLLDGQATEQPEGGLVVRFATPPPLATGQPGAPGAPGGPDLRIVELDTDERPRAIEGTTTTGEQAS